MKTRIVLLPAVLSGILIGLILFNNSCTHDPNFIMELDTVCYDSQIVPIMAASCALSGCHSASSKEEGFDATSYESTRSFTVPGNAKESSLYKVLVDLNGDLMPPDEPLSQDQRNLILIWIEQGANEIYCKEQNIDNPDTTTTDNVCFEQNILPIFSSNCATTLCHDNITQEDDYNLTDYTNIINSGDGVVPYDPDETKIYKVLFETGDDRMPPSPLQALSDSQKEAIRQWISDGALNSDCPESFCDTLDNISYADQVWPIMDNNCVGCHNTSTSEGGVDLSSYTQINSYATQTQNDIPILSGVINRTSGFTAMPPSNSLSSCNVRIIDLWISQGKLNN